VLEGAQVRGERDRPQMVTFTFRVPSGRTAKGYTEYDERFSKSVERGDEAVRIAEIRKTGMPLTGEGYEQDRHIGSARAQAAERQSAALRAENDELRKRLEEQGKADGGGKTAEQVRQEASDDDDVDADELDINDEYDNWTLGELRDELSDRGLDDTDDRDKALDALRADDEDEGEGETPSGEGETPAAEGDGQPEGEGDKNTSTDASGATEPVEGYGGFNAEKAKAAIKSGDEETVKAILAYERQVGKRSTVVSAAEHQLDELAKAHQKPEGS
jgi:hypothetical protein